MNFEPSAEDYPIAEAGEHPGVFDRIEEPEEPGQFGDYLNWLFALNTPGGSMELMGRSSKPEYFTRATKARQWYEAILGRPLAKGEKADFKALRGTRVTLTVDVVRTERGDERNRIVNIRRADSDESPPSPVVDSPPSVDPDFEAWKAEQAAKKAAVEAADAEEPPIPSEPSEETD